MASRETRHYTSTRRAQQAAQTRADIITAATELFERDGWRGTTLTAVASQAGVVVDTIYAGFGSKARLLTAAKDAARDADESQVPYFERPAFRAALRGKAAERLARIAALLTQINERTWRLDTVWRDAAASEPSVRAQLSERELDRRQQLARGLDLLLESPPDQDTINAVWVITGSDVYAKVVNVAGLTSQAYTAWLSSTLGLLLAGQIALLETRADDGPTPRDG